MAYTDEEESSDDNTNKSRSTQESSSSSSSSYDTDRDDVYDFDESFRARDSSPSSASSSESSYYEHDADLEKGKEFYEKISSSRPSNGAIVIHCPRCTRVVNNAHGGVCGHCGEVVSNEAVLSTLNYNKP